MLYDVLGPPLDSRGWAEPASHGGFAAFWDRELFGIEIPPWRHNVVRRIEQAYRCGDGAPVVVADIGCGAALYARHLLAAGVPFEYHGYDHNLSVLDAACRRWEFLPHQDVHLHQMDARCSNWPLDDERFDVVIWDTTLRFCENVEAALDESRRVCRTAILIARTPLEQRTWKESIHYYDMATPSPNWHFDEEYFRNYSRRHEWFFTPRAGDEELQILSRRPLPPNDGFRPIPNLARTFHAAYAGERVRRFTAEIPGLWALYGAGRHTRWLLANLPQPVRDRFGCILDDAAAAGSEIAGIPVLSPDDASAQFAAVLISSDTIEDRLHAAAVRALPGGTPIFRLYEGLPAGPYDKSTPSPGGARGLLSRRGQHVPQV
jgi:ubiquinone/menaquinone biosynthesis C-methylase UbiE